MTQTSAPPVPAATPESDAAPTSEALLGQPLRGIRVIDLTTFLSGPFCTQILADLGAEVIKVEPFAGDLSRAIPPHFVGPDSAYYLGNNRGKRSVAVDLKQPRGQEIVLSLIEQADVVVENFRPGVCERLGLDVAAIRSKRPELIWTSISGFGQTGPWKDRPAYDMIVQALSGVMSLTGEPDRPAVRLGIPAGDLVAGMFAVIGMLAALADRERGASGRVIDVSMLDGQLAMLSYQAVYSMITNVAPQPQGRQHDSIPTYRSFMAAHGRELVITANTERMWAELCGVLGLPELPKDPRFIDGSARHSNRLELWPLLEAAFLTDDAAAWVERLNARGVPAALIKTVPEALDDAAASGRSMIVTLSDEDGRSVQVVGNPIKFVGSEPQPSRFPPTLGQDTAEVLTERLGLTAERIADLVAAGVVKG